MTRSTDDQRLSAACCHDVHPSRLPAPGILVQVLQCSNMMDFNLRLLICDTTHLTLLCQEPFSISAFPAYSLRGWSFRVALISHVRGMPPHRATSGFFPSLVRTT